ncbi:MBL fold metallo-hydrolase [Bdellovibrio sp. HCB337]|uniref:MBL fold metallo-hydrolase n=1 Tax=Bdellovibrio sp. HCB337 TaxID=3394358 RepID=UPI0039A55B5A
MGLTNGAEYSYDGINLKGISLSGIRTAISMPDLSLTFDVAQGYPFLLNLKNFFISHGHLDHAAGIPYIISQKAMARQEAPKFYMPPSLVEPMDRIMRIWEEIEKHEYKYEFIPVKADEEIPIKGNYFMKVFPTTHRIESFGYTLFENHKKLSTKYQGLSKEELIQLRKNGEDVNEVSQTPLVSFTGDTQIEFLDSRPWIRKSKVLLMESTYLDDKKSVEHARTWGHTHLEEILPRLDEIESERIVLIHSSSRYSWDEAQRLLRKQIPAKHRDRVELFPGR